MPPADYYAVQDKLGSVRGLYRRDGTWWMRQTFAPYGALVARDTTTAGASVPLRYGWTGREYDAETAWYYFRARYYDPQQRRFVQEDPAGSAGGSNLYAYVGGRPLEATDPSGMMMEADIPSNSGGQVPWYLSFGSTYADYSLGREESEYDAWVAAGAQVDHGYRVYNGSGPIITRVTVTYGGESETVIFIGPKAATDECHICTQRIPEGAAWYTGFAADFYPEGTGGSLAAGVFLDSHGSGFYTRVALGGGMDVSAAGEVSYSNSFSGLALEFQAGYGRGSGSFTIGPNGKTGGGMSAGVSLTGYSGHIAVTWTTPTYTGYWQ